MSDAGLCHGRIEHDSWVGISGVFIDATLNLRPEVTQQTLHWPSRTLAERADGVAFDLLRHLHEHVDLALLRPAFRHAGEHAPDPAHAFTTGRALAAALVLVEVRDPVMARMISVDLPI